MAVQCTPPDLCCINPETQAVQCYDPAKCQICNETTGAVTKNDPDVLKKECKKCIVDKNGDAQTPTFCDNPAKKDCCDGVCWNASYKCEQCVGSGTKKLISYTEKEDTGCCLQTNTLPDGTVSYTGLGEYTISENKCKECIAGALVNRVPPTNQRCCEDSGEFVDKCYNCDRTSILSPQQKQQCIKCENGILEGPNSACTGNQTCCDGQCCDPNDCCGGKCTTNTGCSYCGYAESLINRCSDPDWNIGVNNPNSNQYGKDTCCGPESDTSSQAPRYVCWDPITERCKKCVDGHLIDKCDKDTEDCCRNGECRKKSDNCTTCDESSGFPNIGGIIQKVIAGQVCCENSMVPETSCCDGQILEANQGCCGNKIYNSTIYDCCNNSSTFKKGDEDCCDLGNGDKTTYNKKDQECCGNTVIWKSLQGCCNGLSYGKTCQTCIENNIVLNYDTGCYGCIESGSLAGRSSGKYSLCKEQKESCCSAWSEFGDADGICYDPDNCDTCTPGKEENEVIVQCEKPLKCCGKQCWNPNDPANKCRSCQYKPFTTTLEKELRNKCVALFGDGTDEECCPGNDVTPSECWTPRLDPCRECTSEGVKPTICKDTINIAIGTTSCCGSDLLDGGYECYSDTCHECIDGVVEFKVGFVASCPHTDGKTYCCKTGEYCASGKCCPNGKINCMNTCCDPDKCLNGLCCPTDCGAKNATTCYDKSECCGGSVINPFIEKCCTKSDKEYASVALSEFKCPLEEDCCGNTCCDKTCCNNKDCCDESCCEGPYGGCYNPDSCQECQNGQVTDKCGEYGECCAGVCYYPSKCETCVAGVVQPPTFSSFCNCINKVEVCECPIAGLRIEIDTENTGHCCDAATFNVRMVSSLSGQGSIIGSINLNNSNSCNVANDQIIVSDAAASSLLNNLVGQDCCNFRLELICDPTGFGAVQPFGPDQCHTSIANGRVFKTLSNGSESLIWNGYLDNTGVFNICDETLLP